MRQHRTTQRTRQCTCFKSVSPFAPTRYSKSNLLHTSNSHYIFRCSSYSSELHPYQIVNYLGFLPKQQIVQNIFQTSPFFHPCTNRTLENNRLLIGHTHLTHSYLLDKEQSPNCDHRRSPLTVEHILTPCSAYKKYYRKISPLATLIHINQYF